ncbi:hypothetical protein C8J57DRAFT_69546 [Mycena rebaudengoi]|nr:hypothetical protein C8J57DRAFT_69546 [Mycena rebaudengoi]
MQVRGYLLSIYILIASACGTTVRDVLLFCARSGTRALSFDDFARDSPSPHTWLGRNTIQRRQSNLSPSHSLLGLPSYCWLTHLLVTPSSRALRRQLTHGFARLSIVPRNWIPRPWLFTSFVVSLHRTVVNILYFSCRALSRHSSQIIWSC